MTRLAAGRATAWSAIDVGGRQIVQLVVSVILARLLTPADFGAIGLLLFFSAFVIVVVHGTLGTALVQQQDTTIEQESVVFWWGIIASVVLAALFILSGPILASFFAIPQLSWLILAIGAQIVVASISIVQGALLARDLRFHTLARAGIVSSVVSGALGVAMAIAGAGVWALAAQLFLAAAVNSLLLWRYSKWRPRAHFSLPAIGGIVRFSSWLGLSGLLEVAYTQGIALVIGKLYGVRDLGLYNRAVSTQQIAGSIMSAIVTRVSLPLFSARRGDDAALHRALLSASRLVMLINAPLLVVLALTADLVLLVLFGPQWNEAGPVLSVLSWAAVVYPIHVLNLQVLLARGRTDTFFRVEVIKKIFGLPCLVIGSFYGVMGLAWGQVAASLIALVINIHPIKREIGCGIIAQLINLSGVAVATTAMAAVVLAARAALALPPLFELAIVIMLGGVTYVTTGFLLKLRGFGEAAEAITALLRRTPRLAEQP